ncbi:helix-turn-helix domain-containing protein [Streptomyces dubilierae]|uniref:Helix-turn-helix transcriptional regulator n=1 Tax=Streptomyces dubilierae TaxID=3075533 RepID=A0ABU2P8V3_9ACTN|nr:helix-turn-helix transcriptional regulator [Streptomyces sp. DSM 41921]MDT0388222.1 helix-turn-helix transcriptional regulator [Streptomyces sp. DSM 41921]
MASLNVGNLGDYLREQRRNAQLSLRQLADAAGVSNPYLSQIERGLRKPSAEVLQQVAKALRISAETLYVRAGILDAERDRDEVETRAVLLADPTLNERQKQVLLQIYESFRKENGFGSTDGSVAAAATVTVDGTVAGAVDGTAPDTGTGIRRPRTADGDRTTELPADNDGDDGHDGDGSAPVAPARRTRKADGGRTATRRTRKGAGGSDTDPRRTAG